MASFVAWLDTSAEEQRRAREMLELFRQKESVDELGIGQIRDAFSDALFPGTSTLHSRARYFLIVAWVFRHGAQHARKHGAELQRWAHRKEREHIAWQKEHISDAGRFGRRVGAAVKVLPSHAYWSGLVRYGILTRDLASDQLGPDERAVADGDAEPSWRPVTTWHPTLPPAPPGFPTEALRSLALHRDEAAWMRERIIDAVPGTLLAHLLRNLNRRGLDEESWAPWLDGACRAADGEARTWLEHAELFSETMHGAALLFNLLVAQRYEQAGHTKVDEPSGRYERAFGRWAEDMIALRPRLASWDRADLWRRLLTVNPRIHPLTRVFVEAWIDAARHPARADDRALRDLVADRERRTKGAQSRLVNERLLRTWQGASGASQLTFRWPQVRLMVTDIADGLAGSGGNDDELADADA
jgi:hypothetical protein